MLSYIWLPRTLFSVTSLGLLFPSILLHFHFYHLSSPFNADMTSPFFSSFCHFHTTWFVPICPSLMLIWLFLSLPRPFYVVSSLPLRLSQQLPESKRSWLTRFVLRLSAWEKRELGFHDQGCCVSHRVFDSGATSRWHAGIHENRFSHHMGTKI